MSNSEKNNKSHEVSLKTRELEIELFWKRSLFFWGFNSVAVATYGSAVIHGKDILYNVIASCFGLICSLVWTLANRGSKYWQENWEKKVEIYEDGVTGPLFKDREKPQKKGIWGSRMYSVSRLAISLSDYLVMAWLLIVSKEFISAYGLFKYITTQEKVFIVFVITIVWIILIFAFARTELEFEKKESNKQ